MLGRFISVFRHRGRTARDRSGASAVAGEERRNRLRVRLQRLLRHPERLLVTVLLVTNMADILALLLLTHRFVHVFGSPGFFSHCSLRLPIYVFVLGVLPKSLFRRFPFRALASLGRMLEIVSTVLWPVLELGKQIGRLFLPAKSERLDAFSPRARN